MAGWSATLGFEIVEIIWIDLLLSGDNAVLIALACRRLPDRQRRWGVALGAAGAVLLRIGFTLAVGQIFATPLLKTGGGVLLLAIAIKLLVEETEQREVVASERLWSAVFSIVAADAVMSLDNVIAIAAAARGSTALIVFGLALSAPLVVFGAGMVMRALDRFPLLAWAGAGLLGWIAGGLIAGDPVWARPQWIDPQTLETILSVAGAAIALAGGWIIEWLEARRGAAVRGAQGGERR